MDSRIEAYMKQIPVLAEAAAGKEVFWVNSRECPESGQGEKAVSKEQIQDAARRLERFAPYLAEVFPETAARNGIIESELREIRAMRQELNQEWGAGITGKLFLKMDSHLPISGSVKARGGIYEVLKHAEDLAFEAGLLNENEDYRKLNTSEMREFFGRYKVQVGSTGNLGLSIGIMSAKLGFQVTVHMSADAKQWKKDLLRSKGVTVIEYESDYCAAVEEGRKSSDQDPMSYFVDDENSVNLFLGYSVAAKRLKAQLAQAGVAVDQEHPLFVHIPCGVGGAPGGVAFGLKQVFGDSVYCFFQEPVQAPCMLLGVMTGLHNDICVQDIGLSGLTAADGLAVGRPSKFVGKTVARMLAGEFTIEDDNLYRFMGDLMDEEGIFIEPSSCASFAGPARLCSSPEGRAFLEHFHLERSMGNATHIAWATGGSLVPEEVRMQYYGKSRELGLENAAKSC